MIYRLRRMIAKSVICKDDFYDLPAETKVLYLYVNMEADDDGFCDSVRAVMRTCGADRENLRQLIDSGFLLEFKGDVVAVRHWKTNNCIRADRYHPTRHAKERASLSVEKTGEYEPKAQRDAAEEREDAADEQLVANLATEDRQGENRSGKISAGEDNIDGAKPEDPSACAPAIPLNDGTNYYVSEEDIASWQQAYPAVDVGQELLQMRAWCLANPKQRKTKNGVQRFIVSWLSKEQDKGHPGMAVKPKKERVFVPTEF